MHTALTIGDFARITHLSVKTLRRYHEAGLLEPVDVDASSGYRYYSLDQVPTAQVIRRFRDLGMPVREIGDVLATDDPQDRSRLIAAHLERVENELVRTRTAVAALQRLLDPAAGDLDIEYRAVPAMRVAAISTDITRDHVLAWYDRALTELEAATTGLARTGPLGGLYDNDLFTAERGRAVLYLPVDDPPETGRVRAVDVPAAELAVAVHRGPHDDIDVTYGRLGMHVAGRELAVAGAVRVHYVIGPRDTSDEARWRTEIAWPVFRTSD